jgi:hypothetical protein
MKQTVYESDFIDAFRQIRPDNFSYDGLKALYADQIELENALGEEIELDVIAICVDFSEYESIEEFQQDYGDEYKSIDDVAQSTTVIDIDGTAFIVQSF